LLSLGFKLYKHRMSFPDYGGRSPKDVAGKIVYTYVACFVRASIYFFNT